MSFATVFLAAALVTQYGQPPRPLGPLRNTFVVAVESVLDQTSALDINAEAAVFDPGMKTVRTSEENLETLAAEERETAIVGDVKSLLFTISSCRIQAVDGVDISRCLVSIKDARTRTMQAIGKHKNGAAWVDGRP